jgi:hypothetical protein
MSVAAEQRADGLQQQLFVKEAELSEQDKRVEKVTADNRQLRDDLKQNKKQHSLDISSLKETHTTAITALADTHSTALKVVEGERDKALSAVKRLQGNVDELEGSVKELKRINSTLRRPYTWTEIIFISVVAAVVVVGLGLMLIREFKHLDVALARYQQMMDAMLMLYGNPHGQQQQQQQAAPAVQGAAAAQP